MGSTLVTCVCLTTHPRRARYLPDALRSYRWQTWWPRELLIVNDGEPLESRADDVRVINLPPRAERWTIGEKRNVGIRMARGEFLATWDDDDVSLPHRLARQMESVLAWNADVVLADRMWVADEHLSLFGACDRGRSRSVMASALVRRGLAVAAGGYPAVDYLEDASLVERIRFVARGHVATMQGADFYVMRRHEANVTLSSGETNEEYVACGLRDRATRVAAEALARLGVSPGGSDVTPALEGSTA